MKNPADYDGTPICICCGNGWPVCAEVNPETGVKFTHDESCARYTFAEDLCVRCQRLFDGDTA